MKGLDMFRRYFSAYQDQYVLIGGAACDILFEQAKAPSVQPKMLIWYWSWSP